MTTIDQAAPSQIETADADRLTKELDALYQRDATAHAMRQIAVIQGWNETELLRHLVIALARDKQAYFDEAVRLTETRMTGAGHKLLVWSEETK